MTMPPRKTEFDGILERPVHFVHAAKGNSYGRGGALATTIVIHVVVIVGLIAGLHVAHTVPPAVLMAQLDLQKRKPDPPPPPPPLFVHPPAVDAPPPVVVIQTVPPPVHTDPPRVQPAPPPAATSPGVPGGEGADSFRVRLLSQLNRFKHYPPEARKAHIEGVAMVHFVMDAGGNVLSCELAKSSGRPILDQEALALIRRAQPLPALPADFPTHTLDAVVPIEFYLR